jgi:hypothetical protein
VLHLPVLAHLDMQGLPVCCRIHCHGLQPHLLASPDDSNGNLAPVRNHDLLEVILLRILGLHLHSLSSPPLCQHWLQEGCRRDAGGTPMPCQSPVAADSPLHRALQRNGEGTERKRCHFTLKLFL